VLVEDEDLLVQVGAGDGEHGNLLREHHSSVLDGTRVARGSSGGIRGATSPTTVSTGGRPRCGASASGGWRAYDRL
jgi:hypothetical protein